MEITKTEEMALRQALSCEVADQVAELTELQLSLVGGGVGEIGLN